MANRQPLSILFIEPNPDHHLLVKYSCEVNRIQTNPVFVTDPLAALDHLQKHANCETLCPKLILLNLFLPDPNKGLALLEQVKKLYPRIPVLVLSDEQTERYVQQVYDLGANSLITKPSDLDDWERQFQVLFAYWFDVVTLAPLY